MISLHQISNVASLNECVMAPSEISPHDSLLGSSSESVGTNPLKTEFASANDFIFERKHQGWKSLSV